jgi:hypothetical protein
VLSVINGTFKTGSSYLFLFFIVLCPTCLLQSLKEMMYNKCLDDDCDLERCGKSSDIILAFEPVTHQIRISCIIAVILK